MERVDLEIFPFFAEGCDEREDSGCPIIELCKNLSYGLRLEEMLDLCKRAQLIKSGTVIHTSTEEFGENIGAPGEVFSFDCNGKFGDSPCGAGTIVFFEERPAPPN